MKKTLYIWQFYGFIFTGISGVILHFLYNWTDENIIIGTFSAINESIWEHLKLLFFPMFIFAFIENNYIGKESVNFWRTKFYGILTGLVLVPTLYYTINGIFGNTPDWINIAIFFIVNAVSYLLETKLFENNSSDSKSNLFYLVILYFTVFLFVTLTFFPIRIPLFIDPITSTYGIQW